MMSAQWAKGHGGLYRYTTAILPLYYRCTRKADVCDEPYIQEKHVVDQSLAILKPIAISPEQANHLRGLIDAEIQKDALTLESTTAKLNDRITAAQEKLNKLTRGYLDELIDEECYQAAKADLVIEKTELKREKERLHRTRASYWNEPAKEAVNALEMAGRMQTEKSPQEISKSFASPERTA